MRRIIQRANDKLGTNWTLHDLRHTAANRMANDPGLTLAQVRVIMRHTDLATTGRYPLASKTSSTRFSSTTTGRASNGLSRLATTRTTSRRCSVVNRTTVETYTVRSRRMQPDEVRQPKDRTKFQAAVLKAAPAPRPEHPPAPFGDLTAASVKDLCHLAMEVIPGERKSAREKRRQGVRMLFGHLETFPGATWQERWEASGFNDEKAPSVNTLARRDVGYDSSNLISALRMAFSLPVFQPSLPGFRANMFIRYPEFFRKLQRDPRLDGVFAAIDAHAQMNPLNRLRAKFDIACVLTTQGIALADLSPSALLHYSLEVKRLGNVHSRGNKDASFGALAAWEVLHSTGHFPHGTPPTLRMFVYNGQKTVEELVDSYPIKNAESVGS